MEFIENEKGEQSEGREGARQTHSFQSPAAAEEGEFQERPLTDVDAISPSLNQIRRCRVK